ncbi:MAG: hypothetical protein V4561_10080 [Bacteroidota bacterium]
MKHTKIALALMISILFFSCKKNDTAENTKPENNLNALEKKLVGTWLFIKSTDSSTNASGATTDVSDAIIECESDDVFTFRSERKYILDDAAKICSSSSSGTEFLWSITADSNFDFTHIHNLGDAKPKVVILDSQYLVIRSRYYGGPYAGSHYVVNTYKRN